MFCSIGRRFCAHTSSGGNIALLEHVNFYIGSRSASLAFFCGKLGFAQDPRIAEQGLTDLLHLNIGLTQLHMPLVGRRGFHEVQRIRGSIDLAYGAVEHQQLQRCFFPDRQPDLAPFTVTCPDGNIFRCAVEYRDQGTRADIDALGSLPGGTSIGIGISAVNVQCPPGSSKAIARFYSDICGAVTTCEPSMAIVSCGLLALRFVETPDFRELRGWSKEVGCDQWHIALYVHDFDGMYNRILEAGLQWDNPRIKDYARTLAEARERQQFRFKDVVDLATGEVLLELEHEVRSLQHPSCPLGRSRAQADALVRSRADNLGRLRLPKSLERGAC